MKYNELIDSKEMESYFGVKYPKWTIELKSLLAKKDIGEHDISDKSALQKLNQTIKFSWLGLFLSIYWAAYHNSKYWLPIIIFITCINVIDTVFFNEQFILIITLLPMIIYGMYGKSYLLAGKVDEYSKTGAFVKQSWLRVVAAIVIWAVPPILYKITTLATA